MPQYWSCLVRGTRKEMLHSMEWSMRWENANTDLFIEIFCLWAKASKSRLLSAIYLVIGHIFKSSNVKRYTSGFSFKPVYCEQDCVITQPEAGDLHGPAYSVHQPITPSLTAGWRSYVSLWDSALIKDVQGHSLSFAGCPPEKKEKNRRGQHRAVYQTCSFKIVSDTMMCYSCR